LPLKRPSIEWLALGRKDFDRSYIHMFTDQKYGCSRLVESPDSIAIAMLSLKSGNEANTAVLRQTSRNMAAPPGGGPLPRPRDMAPPGEGTI
jgi:hypothetical protein